MKRLDDHLCVRAQGFGKTKLFAQIVATLMNLLVYLRMILFTNIWAEWGECCDNYYEDGNIEDVNRYQVSIVVKGHRL